MTSFMNYETRNFNFSNKKRKYLCMNLNYPHINLLKGHFEIIFEVALAPAQHCLTGQNDKNSIKKSSERSQHQHSSKNSPLHNSKAILSYYSRPIRGKG